MEKDKKKTLFVSQPEFPGGPKALTKFIYEQLRYPTAALEAGIEGTVLVEYDIDYQGRVVDTRILQSLGHGCDEEAARVVRKLKFDVGKNRGLKVVFHRKAVIEFRKPVAQPEIAQTTQLELNYTITVTPATPAPAPEKKPAPVTYNYTIPV
jgi:TonB family protein